jgi:hypothetical protein
MKPDLVLYVASTVEFDWMFKSVRNLAKNQALDHFPFIRSAIERAGIRPEALPEEDVLQNKLAPFAEETLKATFERFHDKASAQGIRPALVLLETPNDSRSRSNEFDRLTNLGRSAKLPVLDLQGSFSTVRDRQSLWVAVWDTHTNPQGHRLLADRLYALLLKEELVPTDAQSGHSTPQSAK